MQIPSNNEILSCLRRKQQIEISVSSHGVQVLILHFCECNLTGLDGFKLKLCGVFGHKKRVGGKIEL